MKLTWWQIAANIAGVVALCYGGHIGGQAAGIPGAMPPSVFSVALCVLANLAGLFQAPRGA